jgi:methionyl-tRNA formyltransferase
VETLPRWAEGAITPAPQDDTLATYAPKITREDARLDWSRPAVELERQVRAYRGWPDAFTTWQGKQVKVLAARPLTPWSSATDAGATDAGAINRAPTGDDPVGARFIAPRDAGTAPGRVVLIPDNGTQRPAVVTSDGLLILDTVAMEGKRPADGADFVRGYRAFVGADLGA